MKTNERKQETCKKYDNYLKLIDILGDKIILLEQLIELSILLNIAKNRFEVIRAISEMEKNEVIKKIRYADTKKKIILLKKYAIRYLMGVSSSDKVASLPAVTTNKRYDLRILKNEFIIKEIIREMQSRGIKLDLNNLIRYIDLNRCNILMKNNEGIKYYNQLIYDNKLEINESEVLYDCNNLKMQNDIVQANLNGVAIKDDERKLKTKVDILYNSNIETLMRKNIYIKSIIQNEKGTRMNLYYLNVSNKANPYVIALNYAISYNIMERLFGGNVYLEFNIIVKDEVVKLDILNELNKKCINQRTREPRKESYIIELLKMNRMIDKDLRKGKIIIKSY
ncbi:hypothetical protein [Clostridium botulinum]|uniref:hypothetical protein n=1 Tax=Clostridium botulinum TaxID=1491 RepID=UPI0007735509|nr:hypothetical protein [Clostridium botulinum]